jgi:hypothetical protein
LILIWRKYPAFEKTVRSGKNGKVVAGAFLS